MAPKKKPEDMGIFERMAADCEEPGDPDEEARRRANRGPPCHVGFRIHSGTLQGIQHTAKFKYFLHCFPTYVIVWWL